MTQQNITKGLFWLAFCAFLAVSIPHIAWLYASFEPNSLVWWGIAYLVAIGIDVLVCWVSYVLSRGNGLDKALFGTFIAVLLAWSYFANYLYAVAHTPYQTINVWTISLVFGLTTGTVTPYIIAAAPVFAIGYTFMLGKVGQENTEKLEEKVARLEAEKALKQRLAIAQKGRFTGLVKSAIGGIVDVTSYAKQAMLDQASIVNTDQATDVHTPLHEVKQPDQMNTDKIHALPASVQKQQVEDVPIVKWNGHKVESVQLPGKAPVQVHTLGQQVRTLLTDQPGLSVRKVASQLNIPPSTANYWIKRVKAEQVQTEQVG